MSPSLKRVVRKKWPFSEEEPTWIVLEYDAQKHHSGATEVPHALQSGTEIDRLFNDSLPGSSKTTVPCTLSWVLLGGLISRRV